MPSPIPRKPIGEAMVRCNVGGRSQGLDFMLDCFGRDGLQATFFVETLQRHYFGAADPMGALARRIASAGHEVQLHLHPCWDVFQHADWRERVRRHPRQDDFVGRDPAAIRALLHQGLTTFAEWGLPPPQVFRAGNMQHNDALYAALAQAGMPYASNVGLAIYDSGQTEYRLYAGRHLRHGVLECPVLSFSDWRWRRPHLKTLTISGTSLAEIVTLLERAQVAGLEQVVLLTHPFEYVQSRSGDFGVLRPHALNQRRLRGLCDYLGAHRHRFQTCGMALAASQPLTAKSDANPLLCGRVWQSAARIAGQLLYDRYGEWMLSRRAVQGVAA
nr:polysaccharide deacetylase family protein [uncultured Duganella sp.]